MKQAIKFVTTFPKEVFFIEKQGIFLYVKSDEVNFKYHPKTIEKIRALISL